MPDISGPRWWRDAVVYQIYPRSFADADGDGVGDLAGIIERLGYLDTLGVDALWLSPIFVSPMADFGYDVADYTSVDPVFGSDADLDQLIEDLHGRGMRLLLDWVPNHTSDQHPWFVESRSSRDNPKRDWYVWRDPAPDGGPPNNWIASFKGVPAWTFDDATDQYYLHSFLAEQPDLNWTNPQVEAAMHDVLHYWLDRGVDGFRADVVHLIGKGTELPDLPEARRDQLVISIDEPYTHELLQRIRSLLDSYSHHPMMVGEVYLLKPGQAATYLGEDDELHLAFDFRPVHIGWSAEELRDAIDTNQTEFAEPLWPTWVFSNHDRKRHRTRFGSDAAARAAAVVTLTMRATPFLYAGEELGLQDAVIPPDRVVDPDGRDGTRAPIPWTPDGDHGWGPDPWLPFPPEIDTKSAAAQVGTEGSFHSLYQRLLSMRRESPALRRGDFRWVEVGDPNVLAYRRTCDDDVDSAGRAEALTTVVNIGDRSAVIRLDGTVMLSSEPDRGEGPFDGTLGANEAVILGRGSTTGSR